MKSVGDRLDERFVKPMAINKLCALLAPSIQEARKGGETPSFTRFLELVKEFTKDAIGTGYEPPDWLEEIEEEINRYRNRSEEDDEMLDLKDFIPSIPLRKTDIQRVIRELNPNQKILLADDDDPENFDTIVKELALGKLVDTLNDPDVTMEEVKDLLINQFKNETFVGIDLRNESQPKEHPTDDKKAQSDDDEDSDDDAMFRKLFE